MFLKWNNDKEGLGGIGNREEPDPGDIPPSEFKPESQKASITRTLPDTLIMVLLIIVFSCGGVCF